LDLRDTHIVQDVAGKRLELLRCLHSPLQDGIGVDLEHPCGAPNAQALSQARDDPHDKVYRYAFAMEQGAVGLQKVSIAAGAVQLTPGATAGMAIGAEVA
jgi:hypothetical protein